MQETRSCALYLRSSKDRGDISPATQRRALEALASSRSLTVARIYEDAVESGATEDRPGFALLVRDLRDTRRGWSNLLVYDTSRIARRRHIAQAVKHLAKKNGVAIHYATRPADIDPISEIMLDAAFEAFDEIHSLLSRQKGLAGMAENVRRGWRAGGRAPLGYQLRAIETGAMREGKAVTKSKLEPGPDAAGVREFLQARAKGVPRVVAARSISRKVDPATLVHLEWNALTYAGHTTWNVHREGGNGARRRPRAEWHVTRDTHPALITDAQAEAIVAQLETSNVGAAVRQARASRSSFLLSGLMFSPDGRMWVGHDRYYRLRRRGDLRDKKVRVDVVDAAVCQRVAELMASDAYLEQLLAATRKATAGAAPGANIEERIAKLERERARAAEHSLSAIDAGPYVRLVERRGQQIEALRRELEAVRREVAAGDDVRRMTVADVRALMAEQDVAKAVRTLVERVMLSPTLDCQLRMRAAPASRRGLSVASPEGCDTWPPELTYPIPIRA